MKAILFDFDGTLINSRKANVLRYNEMAKKYGMPIANGKDMMDDVNRKTTMQTIQKYAPSTKIGKEAIEQVEGTLHEFRHHIKLFPYAREVLKELRKKYILGIVTNRGSSTLPLMRHFRLQNYFSVVVTAADVKYPKPNPESIKKALKILKLKPEEAVYVGDFHTDHKAAKDAGLKAIMLDKKCQTKYHIKSLKELIGVMEELSD